MWSSRSAARQTPQDFDDNLRGLEQGGQKTFTVHYPDDYTVKEMAGTSVEYSVTVERNSAGSKLSRRWTTNSQRTSGNSTRCRRFATECRRISGARRKPKPTGRSAATLMKTLAARVTVDIPESLVDRELDRRTEEFARRLMDQNIDPRRANIDWDQFRDSQREADARFGEDRAGARRNLSPRERATMSEDDIEKDVARYAERRGLSPAAVRARLEKKGALTRIAADLRREKTMDYVFCQAQVTRDY